MQQRETLQERIYKDILMRICEGELPNDSSLPTLMELSTQYGVSDNCIRCVISKLKESGYLSTKRGRPARIVYTPKPTESVKQQLSAFSCDKKRLHSFYEAIHILFPSIYTYATFACTKNQLADLGAIVHLLPTDKNSCSDYVDLNIRFFKAVIASVDNDLILYIVKTVMQNAVLPAALFQKWQDSLEEEFLQSSASMHRIYNAVTQNNTENNFAYVKREWKSLFEISERMVEKAIAHCSDIAAEENEKSGQGKGITGLQYADDYKYLLIAHDLYEKILEGKYPVGAFLPTIAEAQKHYSVAKTTVQAAYRILAELEIVTTIHGHGTKVIRLTFSNVNVNTGDKESFNSRRREYMEAIEFLQLVCEDIILHARGHSFLQLKAWLTSDLNPAHRHSGIILCRYLMKEACDPALDIFYQVISRRLYWGAYFAGTEGGITPEEKHSLCMKIADALDSRQAKQAIALTKQLLNSL